VRWIGDNLSLDVGHPAFINVHIRAARLSSAIGIWPFFFFCRQFDHPPDHRRSFIGGCAARIIMGDDEAALLRLRLEKRGEAEPEDLAGNLIVPRD
jgi:hypothetical protein